MVDLFYPIYVLKKHCRKRVQSKHCTITSPVLDPINWETFTTAESTTFTISSMQPSAVFLKSCLMSPKHQSGENLVCPTERKEVLIDLFLCVSTLQAKY
uniref:Uncharacterized protein n=1 Tax=Amphimedon queenslandica TaxID=400682 RepID=A0A1X7VG58_AMPQE